MNIKTGILRELKKTKEYISGQALCEKFGVSRTAVWKVINQLKEEGYDIASVTNKGYILNERPDILSIFDKVSSSPFDVTNYILFTLYSESKLFNFLTSNGLNDIIAKTRG